MTLPGCRGPTRRGSPSRMAPNRRRRRASPRATGASLFAQRARRLRGSGTNDSDGFSGDLHTDRTSSDRMRHVAQLLRYKTERAREQRLSPTLSVSQPSQQVPDVGDVPSASSSPQDTTPVHLPRDRTERSVALQPGRLDPRCQFLNECIRITPYDRPLAPLRPVQHVSEPQRRSDFPSFTPRALAAASASLMRLEIASRSC